MPSDPALSARGASIGYRDRAVIDGLDLNVPRGAFTALIGPNGSGKSTLLRALARLQSLSSGQILLDGRALATIGPREAARRVGILFQGASAPEGMTVSELVQEGRYPHRSLFGRWNRADEAACARALRLTKLEALADRPLDTLSGGQRQRAFVAMVLAQETGILLLDEPTTYLDLPHQLDILELAGALVREEGTTVVAAIHDINQAARYAAHLIVLKDGAVVTAGPPDAIVTPALIEEVFAVKAMVVPSPVDGRPLILPLTRAEREDS
ncbi:ABC transporter ATP-binding protein [Acuticoccus sp. M5D2P5]|uniref:ABC transporter ATP-binding protein n=1 Tax=Acuticoccus kalidii TaxID=2910977 RepID=UPI001F34CF3F|nr:ABC transporter ATP-binding protein [Acuticoccus kalidii]MCF3934003.1 ABC transporter ATP-binding protein [Acuticoccus kalidii]